MLSISSTKQPNLSIPIAIPKSIDKNLNKGKQSINNICELKINFFNPDKCSPPNSWNMRLMDRFYRQSSSIFLD